MPMSKPILVHVNRVKNLTEKEHQSWHDSKHQDEDQLVTGTEPSKITSTITCTETQTDSYQATMTQGPYQT